MENLGNIVTLLTLLATVALGLSDISRRRAEAKKLLSESKNTDASADTMIMTQIKQASIDLVTQLRTENADLENDIRRQREEIRYLKSVLLKAGVSYDAFKTGPLSRVDRETKNPTGQL